MDRSKDRPRRTLCTGLIVVEAVYLSALGMPVRAQPLSSAVREAVQKAGDVECDAKRVEMLKDLRKREDLPKSLAADLDKLIPKLQRYVTDKRLPYFSRTTWKNKDYPFGIAEESPLAPLTWLYRGRMLSWLTMEMGNIWCQPPVRREFLDRARGFFQRYAERFPKNRIPRMYLGEPIPPHKLYPPVPGAPAWAVRQREALERLADIIEWWIDNRMQSSGEFGGGWGDDCEMWRWWSPVLIGFQDPKIVRAQAKFSEALLSQPHMKGGYMSRMTDVEHSAEDSSDAMTPMMHLDPDNPDWAKRAMRIAELAETRWMGKNRRGQLMFKSTYFSVNKVSDDPKKACDTCYHGKAFQPTLLYWQRTGDERLTALFTAWMDTWVDAAMRSERGKPPGVIPSAIHWPDGNVGGLHKDWWDPHNTGEPTLYEWPSALSMMTNMLLLTNYMTGEAKYLEPIRAMAKLRLAYLKNRPRSVGKPGGEMWCAARLGGLVGSLAKYRLLTGSKEFDELLAAERSPYMSLRMGGGRSGLKLALRNTAEALRVNWPGYTSEVRWTDRVLRFPALFGKDHMFVRDVETIYRPNAGLLWSTVTGDPGRPGFFPVNAVRWLTPPRDMAALVTDSGKQSFAATLFHFGTAPRKVPVELYLLGEGDYTLTVTPERAKKPSIKKSVTVRGPRTRLEIKLPPRILCELRVKR